jgi:hypothetical protein
MGRLTVFASNLFNTESGNFSTLQYAQPIPLSGGGSLLQAANPNAPRQYTVSYSFNTGARPGAGLSRGAGGGTRGAQTAGAAGTQGQARNNLGFGRIQFIAPPPGVDPLSVAASRTECTADLKPEAQKVLAQIGVAAAAYGAGQTTLPAVEGLTVTPHGDPKGTWYLGFSPSIPQAVQDKLRAAAASNTGGGAGAPRPAGPPGGEGGPGGPGGFQDRVTASSPNSTDQRRQFTPPPELLAALLPLRAVSACAYGTVLTTTEAKAKGYEVEAGVQVAPPASPAPGASPAAVAAARAVPAASPRPGESPRPGGQGNRGGVRGNALYYAPNLGLFVVRAPDLGTGGGSVKQ